MLATKNKLELLRKTSSDVKARIDELLERDDKIEIATIKTEEYAKDLYNLMKEMAEVANPVLEKLGLDKEAITHDIENFVKILEDNEHVMYFASVNLEAKYAKNKYALVNLSNWFVRLENSIEKIEGFLEVESEAEELKVLFSRVDETELSKKKKEELKEEFLKTLNRLNSSP